MRIYFIFFHLNYIHSQSTTTITTISTTVSPSVTTVSTNYSNQIPSPAPTVNPNGFDPFFDVFIVQTNAYLKAYNVTYWDLINKPIQTKIFLQSLVEDGQTWFELCLTKGEVIRYI